MTDEPVELDKYRGMAAQKATDIRRLLAEVEADSVELRVRHRELQDQLMSTPAGSWPEAAEKAIYVLKLYLSRLDAGDSQHRALVSAVLDDFNRLGSEQ